MRTVVYDMCKEIMYRYQLEVYYDMISSECPNELVVEVLTNSQNLGTGIVN